jgi:hypothetical protein
VLTIPAAARLLAAADRADALIPIARACGIAGPPLALDAAGRRALGLPGHVRRALVAEGRGVLRALCVELPPGTLDADTLSRLVLTVQRRAPFGLWLLLATERGGDTCALATAALHPTARSAALRYDRQHIVDSDAETLRALAAAADGVDALVHVRWHELLGREALSRRFFRALEGCVQGMADALGPAVPPTDARSIALLISTRTLFLAFLQAKGWLDGDHGFLHRHWDACTAGRGGFHRRVLDPLCFGTLNTPLRDRAPRARAFGRVPFLNGGLFARSALEKRHARQYLPDAVLAPLFGDLLGRWRFTVREEQATRAEAAVDPEMLGRAFESLMASPERRASGSFYTPPSLVAHVAEAAFADSLAQAGLADPFAALRRGERVEAEEARRLQAQLSGLTVLDPACGSGAFLVHALESLAAWRAACGDARDPGALRRDVLARQLFGVDRQPTAVWLCELRLWLAVVVNTETDDPLRVPPLPNLDANIRVGDALAGHRGLVADASLADAAPLIGTATPLRRLRERYARATGARKRIALRQLLRAERQTAVALSDARIAALTAQRRDLLCALRSPDLWGRRSTPPGALRERLAALRAELRALRQERRALALGGAVPFDFAAQFADVSAGGGFGVVLGNPPWVRLHHIPPLERTRLRACYRVYHEAAWRAGAAIAGAGAGFAAQVDLAALFVERALALTAPGGTVGLLVPAKLWRSLAGAGVRSLLRREATLRLLDDWSEASATFDAAVYPSVLVARRGAADHEATITMGRMQGETPTRWEAPGASLAFDASPGAPWLWLPPDARDGFAALQEAGRPLGAHPGLRPRLGVKCGCNAAFLATADAFGRLHAADGRVAELEPELVRPLLRGDGLRAWTVPAGEARIVMPHDTELRPLRTLPPRARRWLAPWRPALEARSDHRPGSPWWALYRTEAADARQPRVVWADMARQPRAAVLPAGDRTVPLNTCYVVPTTSLEEAHALAAWLNAPLAAAWLAALAEPARGGYRRLLGWTVGLLPLPADWPSAVARLAPLGAAAASGAPISDAQLLEAALEAADLPAHRVRALLAEAPR